MVKIYQQPFAHAGVKQVIPDASDPQGFVSNEDGFTSDYELPDTDPNYKPIERAEFNGLMNMVTESLGEIQQFGFAKWQPITWPQGARVVEGGVVYRALSQTSQQPPHADWVDELAIGDGSRSLAANGYQKLPSGLIIQWFSVNFAEMGSNTDSSFNYPIAFPNGVFRLAVSGTDGNQAAQFGVVNLRPVSATQCAGRAIKFNTSGVNVTSGGFPFNVIAIGY